MELNQFQERAVKTQGHCTILACPGSGKTRVLSTRAGHLLSNNELGRLCAVTFTRDAANELLERILDTCGQGNMRRIAAGTFHSLAMAQLKRNSKSKMPRLLGDAERSALLRRSRSLSTIARCRCAGARKPNAPGLPMLSLISLRPPASSACARRFSSPRIS